MSEEMTISKSGLKKLLLVILFEVLLMPNFFLIYGIRSGFITNERGDAASKITSHGELTAIRGVSERNEDYIQLGSLNSSAPAQATWKISSAGLLFVNEEMGTNARVRLYIDGSKPLGVRFPVFQSVLEFKNFSTSEWLQQRVTVDEDVFRVVTSEGAYLAYRPGGLPVKEQTLIFSSNEYGIIKVRVLNSSGLNWNMMIYDVGNKNWIRLKNEPLTLQRGVIQFDIPPDTRFVSPQFIFIKQEGSKEGKIEIDWMKLGKNVYPEPKKVKVILNGVTLLNEDLTYSIENNLFTLPRWRFTTLPEPWGEVFYLDVDLTKIGAKNNLTIALDGNVKWKISAILLDIYISHLGVTSPYWRKIIPHYLLFAIFAGETLIVILSLSKLFRWITLRGKKRENTKSKTQANAST